MQMEVVLNSYRLLVFLSHKRISQKIIRFFYCQEYGIVMTTKNLMQPQIKSNGVDWNRLIAVGFGNTKPLADNSTPEGKAENMRVCFVNVSLRGKAIGGMPIDGGGKIAGGLCN
jgi:hypothetical protein